MYEDIVCSTAICLRAEIKETQYARYPERRSLLIVASDQVKPVPQILAWLGLVKRKYVQGLILWVQSITGKVSFFQAVFQTGSILTGYKLYSRHRQLNVYLLLDTDLILQPLAHEVS